MERIVIKPQGVCSRTMTIDYEGNKIVHAEVEGGCRGNLQGICRLIEGMDVINKIEETAEVEDNETGKLKENIVITKVTVDTFGKTYKVEKINK